MRPQFPKFKNIWQRITHAWRASGETVKRQKLYNMLISKEEKVAERTIWADMTCGWHSGFRPCCILFFLLWSKLPSRVMYFVAELKLLHGFQYIPCPLCFVMNQKHLKPLPCDCDICPDESHSHEWCKFKDSKKD